MPDRERLLELALKGLQSDRARLDDEIAEIKRELGHSAGGSRSAAAKAADTAPASRPKRRMSAEAKRKISEAMKRRYAEMRKAAKK